MTEHVGGGTVDESVCWGRSRWPKVDADSPAKSFALTPAVFQQEAAFKDGSVETDYVYDHTLGIKSNEYGEPLGTNADHARSLTFETESLDAPFELTGNGSATLWL